MERRKSTSRLTAPLRLTAERCSRGSRRDAFRARAVQTTFIDAGRSPCSCYGSGQPVDSRAMIQWQIAASWTARFCALPVHSGLEANRGGVYLAPHVPDRRHSDARRDIPCASTRGDTRLAAGCAQTHWSSDLGLAAGTYPENAAIPAAIRHASGYPRAAFAR